MLWRYFGKEITKVLDQLSLVNVATEEEATETIEYLTPEDEAERMGTVDPMILDSNNKRKSSSSMKRSKRWISTVRPCKKSLQPR